VARRSVWETAVKNAIDVVVRTPRLSAAIVLDISDESVLALTAALHLKHLGIHGSSPFVVSREKKLLSLLHFQQLVDANDCGDLLGIWDGEGSLQEFTSGLLPEDEQEGGVEVALIMSECYYFQMQAKPTWAAMAFFYQCLEQIRGCKTSSPLVVPSAARIMLVALELCDLGISHGLAGQPCGFDHTPFDSKLTGWETHWYPYQLSGYRTRAISNPTCAAVLDYQHGLVNLGGQGELIITSDGRCDCVALFVSFDLGGGLPQIDYFDAPYYKHNLMFVKDSPLKVTGDALQYSAQYSAGDSDVSITIL